MSAKARQYLAKRRKAKFKREQSSTRDEQFTSALLFSRRKILMMPPEAAAPAFGTLHFLQLLLI